MCYMCYYLDMREGKDGSKLNDVCLLFDICIAVNVSLGFSDGITTSINRDIIVSLYHLASPLSSTAVLNRHKRPCYPTGIFRKTLLYSLRIWLNKHSFIISCSVFIVIPAQNSTVVFLRLSYNVYI